VATHIRLRPRVADPDPHYDDVTATVSEYLLERRRRALAAGLRHDQVVFDAGLDLGKTAAQSLQLLRDTPVLAGLGSPLLLSASNKTFLGDYFNLEVHERASASTVAVALGITQGCRIVRVHDVAGSVRVRDAIEQILSAP
jgi:dihydropteroate synthase